jgi:hypothetical protein
VAGTVGISNVTGAGEAVGAGAENTGGANEAGSAVGTECSGQPVGAGADATVGGAGEKLAGPAAIDGGGKFSEPAASSPLTGIS